MAVCCQNLLLGALSSRSALPVPVGVLFKKFGLLLNTPCKPYSRKCNVVQAASGLFVLFPFHSLPYVHSAMMWSWPVGEKHVKDVSYCTVGLKHQQFGFGFC
jgi:hypothetical protein